MAARSPPSLRIFNLIVTLQNCVAVVLRYSSTPRCFLPTIHGETRASRGRPELSGPSTPTVSCEELTKETGLQRNSNSCTLLLQMAVLGANEPADGEAFHKAGPVLRRELLLIQLVRNTERSVAH